MSKILIIEDDQIVANIYRNKFSVEGHSVEVALDGNVGLELLRSFRPDAVILDLMLPKMTGVEVMKRIRSEPAFEKLPVIVFSNTYLTDMVQQAWKAGATKCLSKSSCTPKQVIEVLRTTLGSDGVNSGNASHAVDASPAPAPLPAQPSKPAAAVPTPAAKREVEEQADVRRTFVDSLPGTLAALRATLRTMVKADNEPARLAQVQELYRRIHALTGNAGLAGLQQIAQMADALEALLKELIEKPKNINASTMRTVASAVDFLGILFDRCKTPDTRPFLPPKILVVDDEEISRLAITHALEKARLKSVNVEDPKVALDMLSEKPFDLVFLDVDMPGMNGFELCAKLRNLHEHKKTPVVFVTSLTDFESRANSTMSGGTDFIAKPFHFMELAVKALVYVLRGRLEAAK